MAVFGGAPQKHQFPQIVNESDELEPVGETVATDGLGRLKPVLNVGKWGVGVGAVDVAPQFFKRFLKGEGSVGEFYSVALTNNAQQADTGTKMIHLGANTSSTIVSKGISAGRGDQTYRGLVRMGKKASGAHNFTQCDSMLLGDRCGAHTFPYIESNNSSAKVEHEATTTRIGDDQIFLCNQRGISTEDAVSMIVNGFCREVFRELPMEFAVEAQALLSVSLEGSVG